ncbi:hypothetical protein F9278_16435 [Streptomyces phaeolivaceus]|uniref:DUF2690 domain-containing protein n=1 Tax=Streptomyces phaeolivaceus TaxID=2653200 RepID=A0A5P8K424_9ACTN|nr:hypothetical protein [Streptomyces phaeolivaceus]QFQ97538.1 hypothetical protein F9278_16435 [Streptomyces phaeolivaceus]
MTTATTSGGARNKRVLRAGATGVLSAALFLGLAASPAQAAWFVDGPQRSTPSAAEADKSATEAKCRQGDYVVQSSYLTFSNNDTEVTAWFWRVLCERKRG